jgi:hypothetical protein
MCGKVWVKARHTLQRAILNNENKNFNDLLKQPVFPLDGIVQRPAWQRINAARYTASFSSRRPTL